MLISKCIYKCKSPFKFACISERERERGYYYWQAMKMLTKRGSNSRCVVLIVLVALCVMQINAANTIVTKKTETKTCTTRRSPCFLKKIQCPPECPSSSPSPSNPKAKICYIDCESPICKAQCKSKLIFYLGDWQGYYDTNFFP